ncbi:MAG: endonuclease domain-containing protein [Butyricicoccus sp.]|nr:endonuclease domain-containing protein [Butyricicoccus sp.]
MAHRNNPKLTPNAQNLRKGMTKEERHLWYDFLKQLPITVNRQKVIGRYIVDFYCAQAKLIIELDGSQHYESDGQAADQQRDADLQKLGLTVLRYSNTDVNRNFDAVCQDILQHIGLPE